MVNTPFALPFVESGKTYSPGSVALRISNLQRTPEGCLQSVRGPAPLIPNYGSGYPATYGRMHGIFHAKLDSGMRDVLLIRSGGRLLEQTGWTRGVRTLASGLSDEPTARWPDQFCVVGDKIAWTNGIDRPRLYDGYLLTNLGYSEIPATPSPIGPSRGRAMYANTEAGYSHPGRLGTVGDVPSAGADTGSLLAGEWRYAVQFEDYHGNLSTLSGFASVTLAAERARSVFWPDDGDYPNPAGLLDIDLVRPLGRFAVVSEDLRRAFLVAGIPVGPEGTRRRWLYRSMDTGQNPPTMRLLDVIDDNRTTVYPDDRSDAQLGPEALADVVPMQTPRLLCAHDGSLVTANFPGDEGMLRISERGRPGTNRRDRYVYPDPDGAELTAVASWQGALYAWTETSMFRVWEDDGGRLGASAVSGGNGCVAPSSMRPTGNGFLPWLARDGFYAMNMAGSVGPRISEDIEPLLRRIQPSLLGRASAAWSAEKREYVCAVPRAGAWGNQLLLCWDGEQGGFREQDHGIRYAALCETRDARRYVIAAGRDGSQDNVFVLDREVRTYTPPTRTSLFASHWLRGDPLGRIRFDIDTLYVGFLEASTSTITWRTFVNGRRQTTISTGTLTMVMPDRASDALNAVVLGTGTVKRPRLYWKRVPLALKDVDSFAFDLETSAASRFTLAAFSFDGVRVDTEGARVSAD